MQNEETQDVNLGNNDADTTVEETTDYKAEAAKWRAIAERNAKKQKDPIISEQQVSPKPSDILKADEFKLYRQGYSETEIDLIMHNGGAKLLEDKTNPLVLGLEASKIQRNAEDAANKVSDSVGLSDIERKYSEADLRNMTKEDLEKLLPKVIK